jgi:hypothetical protein
MKGGREDERKEGREGGNVAQLMEKFSQCQHNVWHTVSYYS